MTKIEGGILTDSILSIFRGLARISDDLAELFSSQHARYPELSNDEGRRAPKAECRGLIVAPLQDRSDRLLIGLEVAKRAIDIDAGRGETLAGKGFGQSYIEAD